MNTPTAPRERQRNDAGASAPDAPEQAPAKVDPPGGMDRTIKLHVPKTIGGVYVTEITIRRPTVKDRISVARGAGRGKTADEQELIFVGNLCDMMPDEVEALDYADYNQIQDALTAFSGTGR